jgi:NAD+ synthase
MRLEPSVFTIDAPAYTARLCDFIQDRRSALQRSGILVPLSGGLDSSTVLLLCARAVGAEHVTALLLPEIQGNPDAARYARLLTDQLKIKTLTRDITPILALLGTYTFPLSMIPMRALQDWAARKYLSVAPENPFLQIMHGNAGAFQRKGFARFNTKHRIRAVMTYLVAEEQNRMVVGCAHKSEDMLGLFVKFGVDDSADIMPLKYLYRSQITQLAAFLGVPGVIMDRTPNPDIIPGVSDKYMDILKLPSETLDLILFGFEHGLEDGDIAAQLNLTLQQVQQIRALVQRTEHMRNPSQSIRWEEL